MATVAVPVTVFILSVPSVTGIPNIGDRLLRNAYKIELRGESMRKSEGATNTGPVADQNSAEGENLADDIKLS